MTPLRRQFPGLSPGLLRRRAAALYLGVSPTQFDSMRRDPSLRPPLPEPIMVGVRTPVWPRAALDEWAAEAQKIAQASARAQHPAAG